MGMSTCCYLKSLPPIQPLDPPSSSPSLPNGPNLAPRKCDGISWKTKHLVVGLACSMIISVEMGDLMSNNQSGSYSNASELTNMKLPNKKRVAKWSEKRVCPPWHFNSLETIVPENLPRPSAHRKWEWASYSSQSAPLLTSSAKSRAIPSSSSSCFLL